FTFSGEKFYKLSTRGLDKKMGSVYTYKEDYPGANKKLELRIIQWPRIKKIEKTRELTFSHSGKEYSVPVLYQGEIITFVKNYPQTTIDSYAGAPLSDFSRKSLLTKLAELIKGMQETEAVNLLLAFVQKSFAYKTDQQQFGYEKWFFAEETLYYPFSDCEDRSVMFGRLVKDLLGIPVVMLHYPQHLATAVLFSKPVSGDKVKYNNKTYAVCDPTYTGASYGMAMPQFKGVSPEVTEF
ncbi:MAG: hypothetical protein KKH98_01270, partial [Spirochaetes bacterium]|nr:hypothetical protein [Spirochaetota bacterium]